MRSFEKGGRKKEQPSCAQLDGQECPSPHEKSKGRLRGGLDSQEIKNLTV
jgi:hypothetical protein